MKRDVFVPNGDSRTDTAVLLVGTADEYGISQKSIKSTSNGFFITEELADKVYDDVDYDGTQDEDEAEEPTPAKKKTSGNRAAKTEVTEKE